jgi:C1A family cysteine protease
MVAALNVNTVSIAIDAAGLWFQFYRSGVFHRCGTSLDHGVLAVGYGNESGKDFYLVKNSWGTGWGEKGYIKLLRDGDGPGTCGIHLSASYPEA